MHYILSVVTFFLAISAWNLLPSAPSVKDTDVCQSVDHFYEKVLNKHVFSISNKMGSKQDLYDKAFDVLLYELDPLRVVFMQEDVDKLRDKSWVDSLFDVKKQRSCGSFYKTIARFQQRMQVLEKKFNAIELPEIKKYIEDEKTLEKFMVKVADRGNWAENDKQYLENIIWAILTGYQEVRDNTDTDLEALVVAQRMFRRQILTNEINDNMQAQEEVLRALIHVLDAHSQFFSEGQMRDVMQSLTSSFVGVGIVVAEVGPGYKVVEVVDGGPAQSQNALKVGDVITNINGISVEGVSTRVLADLLAGPRKSKVKIDIIRKSDKKRYFKRVAIRRDHVKTKASEMVAEVKQFKNQKLGYVHINHFYSGNSTTPGIAEVIARKIIDFKVQGIDGLVIDLRGNGGGVLSEVIDIAGMFLKSAPIAVEVGTIGSGVQVHADHDGEALYDGPLVVLVDQMSASASEILAGSLQAYNRALIVGSPQTYGKGTIQEIGPINAVLNQEEELEGGVKLTIGFYYLPNGESVQFEGVKSNIVFNQLKETEYASKQEKNLPFALKRPDKINTNFEALPLWLSKDYFDNLIKFTTAQYRVRTMLGDNNQANTNDKVRVQAYNVLADSIAFQRKNFKPALASRLAK